MSYPCTRSQPFYRPITNRLVFSPERSLSPPITTNRSEFEVIIDSVPTPAPPIPDTLPTPKHWSVMPTKTVRSPHSQTSAEKLEPKHKEKPNIRRKPRLADQVESWSTEDSQTPAEKSEPKQKEKPSIHRKSGPAGQAESLQTEDARPRFEEVQEAADAYSESSLSDKESVSSGIESEDDEEDIEVEDNSMDLNEPRSDSDNEDMADSESSDSEDEISASEIIRKPHGSAGRPGGDGYSLKAELYKHGWKKEDIQDVTAFIRTAAPKHIVSHLQFCNQSPDRIKALCCKGVSRLKLRRYENSWPIKDFIRGHIKYARGKLRVNDTVPRSSKRDSDDSAHSSTSVKRRKIDEQSSQKVAGGRRLKPMSKGKSHGL
ncbi:hypothetical protein M422DRAFT_65112 [Sphaerobolus stellatus SS14]|nr:hypothetical protein M422DRAFT_65112 [Sphaerobolus stellatus SS14]